MALTGRPAQAIRGLRLLAANPDAPDFVRAHAIECLRDLGAHATLDNLRVELGRSVPWPVRDAPRASERLEELGRRAKKPREA